MHKLLLSILLLQLSNYAYADDGCAFGYVWREAWGGDHVCTTGASREAVKNDNKDAEKNKSSNSDLCKNGFVWREASPTDHVCVNGRARDIASHENELAKYRRADYKGRCSISLEGKLIGREWRDLKADEGPLGCPTRDYGGPSADFEHGYVQLTPELSPDATMAVFKENGQLGVVWHGSGLNYDTYQVRHVINDSEVHQHDRIKKLWNENYNWYFGNNVDAIRLIFDQSLGQHKITVQGCKPPNFWGVRWCSAWTKAVTFGTYKAPPPKDPPPSKNSAWATGACKYTNNLADPYGVHDRTIKYIRVCIVEGTATEKSNAFFHACTLKAPLQSPTDQFSTDPKENQTPPQFNQGVCGTPGTIIDLP